MLPTLAEVLSLDAVRAGSPRVVAGQGGLDAEVRWVHAIELADAARLLHGGELVLSTGIGLPDDPGLQARYVRELAGVGVSGLAVELGRRYRGALPAPLTGAAAGCGLPLIVFDREVRFVEITEAVHARIINSQLSELRAAASLHEVLTELSVAGAGPQEIIGAAAQLAGRPVILADPAHTVLACAPAGAAEAVLAGFAARSRQARGGHRTSYDPAAGWLMTGVGARGEDWGRVILVCPEPPVPLDYVLVERTATTLALGRLHARQRESLERQAHRTLISAILAEPGAGLPEEAATRARALGLPVAGRQLIALVARLPAAGPGLSAQARVLEVADAVADACRAEPVPAIVGSLDDLRAAALLSFDARADPDPPLTSVCQRIRQLAPARARPHQGASQAADLVLAAGSAAGSMDGARRSFSEARQVADAAAASQDPAGPAGQPPRPFLRLADLRLPGLLQLLRGDPRLQSFAEREVGRLLAYDASHGTSLVSVLAAFLEAGGNKAEAARRAHLARPTLYERLGHIERVLGVSLDSALSRTSLHVALLAQPPG
ncbi:MAG TPA: PucR family transcriptional regulator ligand-binding domain-containing protein [Streptosporangiaceae bacterium]